MVWRGLYHIRPPALQTKHDMHPTLLISWWCTACALVAILVRVCGRYIRTEKLFQEDKIMAASIIPLMIRMGLVHLILIWGTNNTMSDTLSDVNVWHREVGSKLVLASRIFYAAFIWVAKLTVLQFLKRIVGAYWRRSYENGLQVIRYFLLATFLAVVVTTLAECHPFNHYWQVIPDPGPQCREGAAQLLTMGICDIITDLILVAYPIPIVIVSAMPMKRKASLVLLFALSLALVAITAYRIPSTIRRGSAQQYRSLLASLEILAAAGVSNSIVIGSFIRDRGVKKIKYRRDSSVGGSSIEGTMTKRTTMMQNHFGSDFDLVSDVGMCLAPDLQSRGSSVPSTAHNHHGSACRDSSSAEKGEYAKRKVEDDKSSMSTNATDLKPGMGSAEKSAQVVTPPLTPMKMSFFDVDNLMQRDEKLSAPPSSKSAPDRPQRSSSIEASAKNPVTSHPHSNHQSPSCQDSSTPLILADVGDLLSPTRSSAHLDRSTALPPAARHAASSRHHHHHHHQHQHQPNLSPTPSCPENLSTSPSHHIHKSTQTNQPPPPPPPPPQSPLPPSYQPRRASQTTSWNVPHPTSSTSMNMNIVDAGGLLSK